MSIYNPFKDIFDNIYKTGNSGGGSTPPDPEKVITRDYYNLLMDIMSGLEDITKRLQNDDVWNKQFPVQTVQIPAQQLVTMTVIQDIVKVCHILSGGDIKKDSVEHTGLMVICTKLLKDDMEAFQYDMIAKSHEGGLYNHVSDGILPMGLNTSPFLLTGNNATDEGRRFDLAMPVVLKDLKHKLRDEYNTLLYRFATVLAKADSAISDTEETLLKDIYNKINKNDIPTASAKPEQTVDLKSDMYNPEDLKTVLSELDELIGLNDVKKEVRGLVNFIEVQRQRASMGLKSSNISYHCVFTGAPGTGKTTIARLIARVYAALGVLQKGQLIETDRAGLVAEYVGQTAPKVDKVVEEALDGILFIDEAYALAGQGNNDYGKEAIATLIKRMEDYRARLVLIMAGYIDEMETLIESNPGFESRFNRFIHFPDYTPDEMLQIFEMFCKKAEYKLSAEATGVLKANLQQLYDNKQKDFGNARLVRNLFEASIENQSNRIATSTTLTKEILTAIEATDIPAAAEYL
jgi:AAA+ superfamily predicted ATPase